MTLEYNPVMREKRSAGRPGLSDDASVRVRALLREGLEKFKTKSALAEALGLTAPAISQILSGKNNPSADTAERIAKLLGKDPTATLFGHVEPVRVEWDARYPKQREAILWMRAGGEPVSDEDAQEVERNFLLYETSNGRAPEVSDWVTIIRNFLKRKAAASAGIAEDMKAILGRTELSDDPEAEPKLKPRR